MRKSDFDLQALARERILSSELPLTRCTRVFGGRGSGQSCALCHKPIGTAEIEYEVEAQDAPGKSLLAFHIECCAVWRSTCQHLLNGPP